VYTSLWYLAPARAKWSIVDEISPHLPALSAKKKRTLARTPAVTSVICRPVPMLTDNRDVKPDETLSRWVSTGVPIFIGVGMVAAFVLRLSFGLPLNRLAFPIAGGGGEARTTDEAG